MRAFANHGGNESIRIEAYYRFDYNYNDYYSSPTTVRMRAFANHGGNESIRIEALLSLRLRLQWLSGTKGGAVQRQARKWAQSIKGKYLNHIWWIRELLLCTFVSCRYLQELCRATHPASANDEYNAIELYVQIYAITINPRNWCQ